MKKGIKISAFALITILSLTFAFPSFASEEADTTETSEYTESASLILEEDNKNEESLFEALFTSFEENASEILSALAFVGSLIIMLCYKRGLLPIVNDGIKAIKSGLKAINEKSESFNQHAVSLCESIDTRLERAEKLSEAALRSTEYVEEELALIKQNGDETKKLKIILGTQIDMLGEIFMSAALPQYLKDSVGEKIGEMKAALGKEVDGGENS